MPLRRDRATWWISQRVKKTGCSPSDMVCLKGFLFGYYNNRRRGFQTKMKGGEIVKTGLVLYDVGNDTENCIKDATLQGQIPAWADIVEIVAQNS